MNTGWLCPKCGRDLMAQLRLALVTLLICIGIGMTVWGYWLVLTR